MDINLINLCKELIQDENTIDVNNQIFFNSADDYKDYCMQLLKQKLKNVLNNKRIPITNIINIQKVYSPDNNGTIDNLSLLECDNLVH